MKISASGMKAQSLRMRVVAENLANQDSYAPAPGVDPYRRKLVTFRATFDALKGIPVVRAEGVVPDRSPFGRRLIPGHPGADAQGYVQTPNVSGLVEATDMREAQRSYEANVNAVEAAKSMMMRTVDLLR
jgi:flagellar basal-body rod protein FlgC